MSYTKHDNEKNSESNELSKIIISVKNGDNEAFSSLVDTCYNEVFGIAMSNLQNYDIACDITQEALIEIFYTIKSLRSPEAFHSWLKKITYHKCTNYFRSKIYRHETLLDETEEIDLFDNIEEDRTAFIPEASLDSKELIQIIRSFLKKLPDEQHDAVIMYYFNDAPLSEIAEIQKAPIDTVKSRLYYARKALKKTVEAYEKKHDILLHPKPSPTILSKVLEKPDIELTKEDVSAIAEGILNAIDTTKNNN